MEESVSGPVEPLPVMPVVSLIYCDPRLPAVVGHSLESHFGGIALASEPFSFDMSDYYEEEMGEELRRVWMCFVQLADPAQLPAWKSWCHRLEMDLSLEDGNRTVNIDPGYLDYGKLVLASFKEAPDKIYMGSGVWAHTCLRFGHGRFTAPDHSFPDFRDGRFDGFMLEARRLYRGFLRSGGERNP
jgi:hypothetical protein